MRILFFLLFISLVTQPIITKAQSVKEMQEQMQEEITDLKKQIVDLEKEIATAKTNKEDLEIIKEMEKDLAQLKKQLAIIEKAKKGLVQIPESVKQKFDDDHPSPTGFPAKKTTLLNALPKQTLTQKELITFLVTLHNELKKKLPPESVKLAEEIITKFGESYAKIAITGVAAWYNNAPSESVLLLTYASSKSTDDNTLNNCGAILNLSGREEKALPILKYVLPHQPNNCTLLNNIGQAFAGLGEKDSAMFYFHRVMKKCSTHPDACATAAYIAYSNGDIELAAKYMEQSLAGAYSEERLDFYKMIKPSAKPLIDSENIGLGTMNYFIPNGFGPAPNCRNWNECEIVTARQEASKKQIDALQKKYENIVVENSLANILKTPQGSADWASGKGWKPGPFAKKAQYIKGEISSAYTDARTKAGFELVQKITLLTEKTKIKILALDKEFEPQYKACEGVGGNCLKNVMYKYCLAVCNEYFSTLTKIAEDFEEYWYPKDVKHYNNLVFLTTLTSPNKMVLIGETAAYTGFLLTQIDVFPLSECHLIAKPDCIKPPPAQAQQVSNPLFKEGECPINVKIPFVVGKISLNCEAFGFEAGEGITFRYEKNFKSRESTIAVGVGVSADIPGLDAGAGVEIGVKFDSNYQPIDLIGGANAGVSLVGMNTSIVSIGATVGVNSAFTPAFTVMGR